MGGYEVDPTQLAASGKSVGAHGDALIAALTALETALTGSELRRRRSRKVLRRTGTQVRARRRLMRGSSRRRRLRRRRMGLGLRCRLLAASRTVRVAERTSPSTLRAPKRWRASEVASRRKSTAAVSTTLGMEIRALVVGIHMVAAGATTHQVKGRHGIKMSSVSNNSMKSPKWKRGRDRIHRNIYRKNSLITICPNLIKAPRGLWSATTSICTALVNEMEQVSSCRPMKFIV